MTIANSVRGFPSASGEETRALSWRDLLMVVGGIAIAVVVPPALLGVYVVLAIRCFIGPEQLVQSLTLSWLLAFLIPGLTIAPAGVGALKWIVLASAIAAIAASVARGKRAVPVGAAAALLFGLLLLFLSIPFSYFPTLSILKAVAFSLGTAALLIAAVGCSRGWLQHWAMSLFFAVVLTSAPVMFMPAGYFTNGWSFQGVLNHPQPFGVFLTPIVAWQSCRFFLEERASRSTMIALVAGWTGIYLSNARTALISVLLGITAVLLGGILSPRHSRRLAASARRARTWVVLALAGILVVTNFEVVKESTLDFITKKQDNTFSSWETLTNSRAQLIELSYANFASHPWTGIGLGVSSDLGIGQSNQETFLGLPTSAPVEKGFIFSAVLEEIGLSGALALVIFLLAIALPVYRNGELELFALIVAALATNIGEFTLFSLNGVGMYVWIMTAVAYGASRQLSPKPKPMAVRRGAFVPTALDLRRIG